MEWLRKLDAALDSAMFRDDKKEDPKEPSTEDERRNEFEFDYFSNEFNDAPQNEIIHDDSIIQNEAIDEKIHSIDTSFQTHVHAQRVDWKRPAPPLGLPGMLRPVLRTRGDDSSDESDEEEQNVDAPVGDDAILHSFKDAPSEIETVVQHTVSPISSPDKKTLQFVSDGESIPSHLNPPSLQMSNLETNHDDIQKPILNIQKKEEGNPKHGDHHDTTLSPSRPIIQGINQGMSSSFRSLPPPPPSQSFTVTTPSRPPTSSTTPSSSSTTSRYMSPSRRHKAPIIIMPSEEQIIHDTELETNTEKDLEQVDGALQHHASISLQQQHDDTSQQDRSSFVDHSNSNLDSDPINPPDVIEAAQSSMDTFEVNNTRLIPSRLKSESDDTDMKTTTVTNEKSEEIRASFGDFMPSYHYNDDDDALSDISALEGEDYEHGTILNWDDDFIHSNFKSSMNCHGVVHVRLLRAQHMPCSSNTVIQAIIHLPPWNGKVRFKTETTYVGPSKAGICVRWDKRLLDHDDDLSLDEDDAQPPCISMVHAYNDEDTPIPNIVIEMKDKALQMFESDLCSLSLSCAPLMETPGQFRRRWCRMKMSESNQGGVENDPLLLIEAAFEPTHFDDTASLEDLANDAAMDLKLEPNTAEENNEEIRSRLNTAETNDNSSQAQLSARTKTSQSQKKLSSKPHMFRNYTKMRPTFCALCDKMIMWKLKGYQCEVCNLDCCSDCLLRIDVEMPCGSKAAQSQVDKLQNSKFSLSKIYDMVAPIKDGPKSSDTNEENLDLNEDKNQRQIDSVGTMHLKIKQACIYSEHFAPEAEIKHILASGDRWIRKGDYYVRVSWTGSTDTKRTKTVFQTSKPRFDSAQMSITA